MDFYFGRSYEMTIWSKFHICFLVFNIILTTVLIILFRKCKPLTLKIVVGIAWLIMVGLEIGKQINWSYAPLDPLTYRGISMVVFPYAICSLPYYIWPLFIFLPDCKFRTIISIIIGVYIFYPAVGFQFYPGTLCTRIYINHQTMIHHGLQLAIGLLVFVHEYKKFTFKNLIFSSLIMVGLAGIAIALNVVITNKYNVDINLWELNPLEGHATIQPVYKDVYNLVPFPVYFIIYMIIFISIGIFTYFFVKGIIALCSKIKPSKKATA